MPKFQKEMQGIPKKLNSATGYLVAVFNSFGAEYRGATFVGVERQSLHQVKGGSLAQFIVSTISTGYYLSKKSQVIGFATEVS